MSGRVRFLLLGGFGVLTVRVGSSDRLLDYVNPTARPYVLAAGGTLAVLGMLAWLVPAMSPPPRIGALLLLPVSVLLLVVPPSQGALVGHRRQAAPPRSADLLPPLPRGPATVPLAMVVQRAIWARGTLRGHVLRIVGFVAGTRAGHILIGRLTITCCAADAQEDDIDARVDGRSRATFREGEWLVVTGRFVGMSPTDTFVPELQVLSATAVPAPADPYD